MVEAGAAALVNARRLLRDGRPLSATAIVDAESNGIRILGETRPGWLTLLADMLLAGGRFRAAVDAASRAVAAVEATGGNDRRRASAWLSLAFAETVGGIVGDRRIDPLQEAERLVAARDLGRTILARRVRRLRARILSAKGDLAAATTLLDDGDPNDSEPTKGARREALHAADERAIILLRQSETAAAITAFESCARNWSALLHTDAPQVLAARHNLAVTLRRSTRRGEALDVFRDVVRARAAVIGAEHPDTLVSRSFWLLQRAEGGDRSAAAEIAKTLVSARKQLGDTHPFTFQISGRVASIQALTGNAGAALTTLHEWSHRAEMALGLDHPETASLLHEYAGALRASGDLAKAYRVFSVLADATVRARGETHIETLATYNNLAVVASDLGEAQTAESLYRDLLAAFAKTDETHALGEASVKTNLAHLLLMSGRAPEAGLLFESVLKIRERLLESDNRLVHLSRSNVAASLAKSGRFDEAIDMHRRVLTDRIALFGATDPQALDSLHALASTLDKAGRPAEGVPLFERVVSVRLERLGPRHPNTIASQRGLAAALRAIGRRDDAAVVYRQVLATVEGLREEGDLPDELRRSLFAQYVPAYRALAFMAIEDKDARAAFAIAEKIKARTLLERTASRQRLQSLFLGEAELLGVRDLERRIAAADARIPTIADAAGRNRATVERNQLLEDWRRLTGTIKVRNLAYGQLGEVRLLAADEGTRDLARDERFLTFIVDGSRVGAIWLHPDHEPGCLDLGTIPNLIETVRAASAVLASGHVDAGIVDLPHQGKSGVIWRMGDGSYCLSDVDHRPAAATDRLGSRDEILNDLSQVLLDGLPASLFDTERLLLSPDGVLAAVPFEVLRFGGESLLQCCAITYVVSLSFGLLLNERRDERKDRTSLIAIGAPVFEPSGPQEERPTSNDRLFNTSRHRLRRHEPLKELNGAAVELRDIADLFGLVEGQTLFTGSDATASRIRQLSQSGSLRSASALLFSTHGYLDADDARRNAIVLGSEANDESGDLTAAEIVAFDLDADLVFLSACDTGAGSFVNGEGVLGLPFAFMIAGSRTVVQTLWPIFDVASALLVRRFFRHYRDGRTVANALASAKRELASGAEGDEYRDPVYWAAFLCYGR